MKIVVNRCYGGFGLSHAAVKYYLNLKGLDAYFYKQTSYKHQGKEEYKKIDDEDNLFNICYTIDYGDVINEFKKEGYFYYGDIERNDPLLVKTVEDLGTKKASGRLSSLEVVEIPDDVQWEIDDYDGQESIHEIHRSW